MKFVMICSEDNGKTFIEINDRVSNAYIRKDNGLQKHPFKPERVGAF